MYGNDGANSMTDRLPPQNLEAERGVLCACLLDHAVVDEVAMILEADDFYRECHQEIWRAIWKLHANGTRVDAISLADELTRDGKFKAAGGDGYLLEISNAAPHAANAVYHAGIVREKATARRLIQGMTETLSDAYSGMFTAGQLVEQAEKRIFGIGEKHATGGTLTGDALAAGFVEMQMRRQDGEVEGLTTGLPDLDEGIGGMRPGQLIILAAKPGQGKTALGLNVTQHVAMDLGKPVLFVSLEMTANELAERWAASMASIDSKRIRNPRCLTPAEHERIGDAMIRLSECPVRIDDTPAQTLTRIAANARRTKAKYGLALLVIDYLGYVNGEKGRGESRYDEVSRISRGLKALAKELGVPVLAMHQLNRKHDDRSDRRPRMADLRDSGQIEADADVVMLLHGQAVEGQPTGRTEVIIPKCRNAPPGVVNLFFNGPFTRFDPIVESIPTNGQPY